MPYKNIATTHGNQMAGVQVSIILLRKGAISRINEEWGSGPKKRVPVFTTAPLCPHWAWVLEAFTLIIMICLLDSFRPVLHQFSPSSMSLPLWSFQSENVILSFANKLKSSLLNNKAHKVLHALTSACAPVFLSFFPSPLLFAHYPHHAQLLTSVAWLAPLLPGLLFLLVFSVIVFQDSAQALPPLETFPDPPPPPPPALQCNYSIFVFLPNPVQSAVCVRGSHSHRFSQLQIEIFRAKKKIPRSSKKQNLNLSHSSNCLHGTHIALGFVSNPEMIYSIWEDVYGLYANTTTFYVRDLSILGFWYPWPF